MKRIIFLLFVVSSVDLFSQSDLTVTDRGSYIDISAETKDIPLLVKKYSSSKKPVQLYLSAGKELKEEHFEKLSGLPLTYLRFGMKERGYYCGGMDKLQQLDSIELEGFSHPFLKDASKISNLKYLRLEFFYQDSTLKEKASFNQISKLLITLTNIKDLSTLFDSLTRVKEIHFVKNIEVIQLSSCMTVLKNSPLEELEISLCTLDTTNFKSFTFPHLKKAWTIGVHSDLRKFSFISFIEQCPELKFIDITMNGLSEEFEINLQKKFPGVTIKRNY